MNPWRSLVSGILERPPVSRLLSRPSSVCSRRGSKQRATLPHARTHVVHTTNTRAACTPARARPPATPTGHGLTALAHSRHITHTRERPLAGQPSSETSAWSEPVRPGEQTRETAYTARCAHTRQSPHAHPAANTSLSHSTLVSVISVAHAPGELHATACTHRRSGSSPCNVLVPETRPQCAVLLSAP